MPRNGLTRERVVEAAVQMIEQSGIGAFSMRALADFLNIKPASLYNHIDSIDALLVDVCTYALQLQRETELQAIAPKTGNEKITALAFTYRQFAREHRELYHLIINRAVSCNKQLEESAQRMVEPFFKALEHTSLTLTEQTHWQRILRALVHGFIAQEDAGFFSHISVNADESFQTAVQCYLDGLAQAQKRRSS